MTQKRFITTREAEWKEMGAGDKQWNLILVFTSQGARQVPIASGQSVVSHWKSSSCGFILTFIHSLLSVRHLLCVGPRGQF